MKPQNVNALECAVKVLEEDLQSQRAAVEETERLLVGLRARLTTSKTRPEPLTVRASPILTTLKTFDQQPARRTWSRKSGSGVMQLDMLKPGVEYPIADLIRMGAEQGSTNEQAVRSWATRSLRKVRRAVYMLPTIARPTTANPGVLAAKEALQPAASGGSVSVGDRGDGGQAGARGQEEQRARPDDWTVAAHDLMQDGVSRSPAEISLRLRRLEYGEAAIKSVQEWCEGETAAERLTRKGEGIKTTYRSTKPEEPEEDDEDESHEPDDDSGEEPEELP